MRMTPKNIAHALIDSIASSPEISVDAACESAIQLLKKRCPGVSLRDFLKCVEREMRRKHHQPEGLLIVPNAKSISAEKLVPLLSEKSGAPVHLEQKIDPDIIGGDILLVEHKRIDCSIQGALQSLLRTLQTLH